MPRVHKRQQSILDHFKAGPSRPTARSSSAGPECHQLSSSDSEPEVVVIDKPSIPVQSHYKSSPLKQTRLQNTPKRSRNQRDASKDESSESDIGRIKFGTKQVSSADDSEEEVGKRSNRRITKKRRLAGSDEEDIDKQNIKPVDFSSDSENNDVASSPRKLVRGIRPKADSEEDSDGIDEESASL